jgi:hypothetical protein
MELELNKLTIMPHDDYRAAPGLNYSGISSLKRTPKTFKHRLEHPAKQTPAMYRGGLAHTILFEKGAIDRLYKAPDVNKRTNAGKLELEAFRDSLPAEAIVVEEDDWEMLDGMYKSFVDNKDAMDLISGGTPEVSIAWEEDGIRMKARADVYCGTHLVDLKTTERADPYNFEKSVGTYNYHIQGVHYMSGFTQVTGRLIDRFYFIAMEKDPPYQIAIYQLEDAAIEIAEIERNRAIRIYRECMETDKWPGFEGIKPIGVPAWKMNSVCIGE